MPFAFFFRALAGALAPLLEGSNVTTFIYARIDANLPDNPKILELPANLRPFLGWLQICAICYARRNMTDGLIRAGAVEQLIGQLGPPPPNEGTWIDMMLGAGLWDHGGPTDPPGSIQVHDFLDYNLSKQDIENRARSQHEGGRLGGIRSGKSRREKKNQPKPNVEAKPSNPPLKQRVEGSRQPIVEKRTTQLRPERTILPYVQDGENEGGSTPPQGSVKALSAISSPPPRSAPLHSARLRSAPLAPGTTQPDENKGQTDPIVPPTQASSILRKLRQKLKPTAPQAQTPARGSQLPQEPQRHPETEDRQREALIVRLTAAGEVLRVSHGLPAPSLDALHVKYQHSLLKELAADVLTVEKAAAASIKPPTPKESTTSPPADVPEVPTPDLAAEALQAEAEAAGKSSPLRAELTETATRELVPKPSQVGIEDERPTASRGDTGALAGEPVDLAMVLKRRRMLKGSK